MTWILLAVGCGPAPLGIGDKTVDAPGSEPGTGFATGPWEDPTTPATSPADDAVYEGAYVRILTPAAGEVVALGEPYPFSAEVFGADGAQLDAAAVQWFASDAPDFEGAALGFTSDALPAGAHDLTVVVDLANGDRVAETLGGVQVQSNVAGTYAGLFSVDGTVGGLTITCTGSAVVVLDALGEAGSGDGDCLVSLLGADVPMTWLFSLDRTGPELTGSAAVDLVGVFKYQVPMTSGTVDPAGSGLSLAYAATIPFVGDLSAFLEAPRISLDTE